MIIEEKIVDGFNEQEIIQKSRLANFRTLGNKFFQAGTDETVNPVNQIKESLQFYKLPLAAPYNEILIKYDYAPVFWISSSPLISRLESYIKETAPKEYVLDYFNYIKEFYFKWIIVDTPADKQYFAVSALNALKRNSSNNFITNVILRAIILIYEKSVFDPDEAENTIKKAFSLAETIDIEDELKKELEYILNIYYGFIFLKQQDAERAIDKFTEALSIKPGGINATFYLALAHAKLNNIETTENFIRNVYEYDQRRIAFAIEQSNFTMFNRFVRKPVTAYIFNFRDFLSYADIFRAIKERNENLAIVTLHPMRLKIAKLKEIRASEFYDDEMLASLEFLEKVVQVYIGTENTMVLGSSDNLVTRFEDLVQSIRQAIEERADNEINERLKIYDKSIDDSINETQRLKSELDQIRESLTLRLSDDIDRVSKIIASNIKEIELEIQRLDSGENYNPKYTFNNSMTYSIIISFIIFMIGGLAGYLNSNEINVWEFKNVMSIVFTAGLKWAAVSLFVGTLISFVLSASTFLEKSNRKQQLLQEIGAMKSSKEKEIEKLKLLAEEREQTLEERFEKRVKDYQHRAEDLKEQKIKEVDNLKETAMSRYAKLDRQLAALLH